MNQRANLGKYLLIFFSAIGLSNQSMAEDATTIYAVQIDGVHQSDFSGAYDTILSEATPMISRKYSLKALPPDQAFAAFDKCTNCCLSPANANPEFYDYPANYLVSDAINVAKIYVFSRPGTPPIVDVTSLKGRKVVARAEMPYGRTIDKAGLSLDLAANDEINIEKMKAGSADAMIAYVPDAYLAFESKRTPVFPHQKDRPVAVHPDSVICKPDTGTLVTQLNAALKKLRDAGRIKAVMGLAYIPE